MVTRRAVVMRTRHFLSRHILALLLIVAMLCAVFFDRATADWRSAVDKIEFSRAPHIHYDITSAELWRCSTSNTSSDQLRIVSTRGHQHDLEILKHTGSWVDVLTSSSRNPSDKLRSLGLTGCSTLTSLNGLLTTELEENWRTLQHHDLHPSWQNNIPRQFTRSASHQSTSASVGGLKRLKRDAEVKTDNGASDNLFAQYHNYSSMYNWYHQLAYSHPDLVTLNDSIGQTHYGRNIFALHFTDGEGEGEARARRPKIYFQCLLHPREWISGSVCMYLAKYLASPDSQPKLKELLSKVEFVMVPVANPDGYYLTWYQYPKFRLWRKNAQAFGKHSCAGVDLNRNFDVTNWNQEAESGSSDVCSELYRGPSAGSELEVKAISSFFESLGRAIGAVDFHSYHQEILYPPASHFDVPEDILSTMDRVASSVASSVSEVGVDYSFRKMVDVYSATGTFADWLLMRSISGSEEERCLVPLTIELRPSYTDASKGVYHGFLLPATEILSTCQEMLTAFIKFSELAYEQGRNCFSRP